MRWYGLKIRFQKQTACCIWINVKLFINFCFVNMLLSVKKNCFIYLFIHLFVCAYLLIMCTYVYLFCTYIRHLSRSLGKSSVTHYFHLILRVQRIITSLIKVRFISIYFYLLFDVFHSSYVVALNFQFYVNYFLLLCFLSHYFSKISLEIRIFM